MAVPKTATTPIYSYPRTRVLDPRSRLVLNRFTGGWTASLRTQVLAAGGIDAWFAQQLSSTSDSFYSASSTWWPSNMNDPATTLQRDSDGIESIWEATTNYQRWSLVRRVHGRHQVRETMAAFWENHFHVPTASNASGAFRAPYGRMIRSLALGRFSTLLHAVSTHPAMGTYLGNATSTKKAPNENQGRELLELHTVGREAGFTEDDVKSSARILTGYRVDVWRTWAVAYDPAAHWTGRVTVLGFSHPNTNPDGRGVTKAYLDYLARHPATATRIARKLATRFVSDAPSSGLVAHLAQVYRANDTRIAPVIKALIAHPEFKASAGKKTRTPEEDVIATYRALGVTIASPVNDEDAANAIVWQASHIGQEPYGWPRPDGLPDTGAAWSSVSRMLASFDVHYTMSGGWWPRGRATYRKPAQWLPQTSIRFDQLVDHLSRRMLGRPSTVLVRSAASQATGIAASTLITAQHDLVRWNMSRLLTVLLDNPHHIGR